MCGKAEGKGHRKASHKLHAVSYKQYTAARHTLHAAVVAATRNAERENRQNSELNVQVCDATLPNKHSDAENKKLRTQNTELRTRNLKHCYEPINILITRKSLM